MDYKRTYDISCVYDPLLRNGLENAIEAINLACTSETNAWSYVESKEIFQDYNRTIDSSDTMKNTIFEHMKLAGHSGSSIVYTLNHLVSLTTDYPRWRRENEEENSKIENEKYILNSFRQNRLIPHYRSMSGGGSIRTAAGPLVSEFLEIRERLYYSWLPEVSTTFKEVTDLLGITPQEKLDVLDDILNNVYSSTQLITYRNSIYNSLETEKRMDTLHTRMLQEQITILKAAIESRNPTALKAALNPGWGSMRFIELKEYKYAQGLLEELT